MPSSKDLDATMDRFLEEQGFNLKPGSQSAVRPDPPFGVRTVEGPADLPRLPAPGTDWNPANEHIRRSTWEAIGKAQSRGLAGALRDYRSQTHADAQRTARLMSHDAAVENRVKTPAPATTAGAGPAVPANTDDDLTAAEYVEQRTRQQRDDAARYRDKFKPGPG